MQAVAVEFSGYAEKFHCLMHTAPYADTPKRRSMSPQMPFTPRAVQLN
jgi:hypothetical protein